MKKSAYLQKAERDLAKTVKAFNQSVSRAIAAGKVPADIAPAKESVRAIKAAAREMTDAEKRAFYREQIRTLKKIRLKTAFEIVTSPAGAQTTKFELRRAKAAIRKENALREERAKARAERPVKVGGKEISGAKRVAEDAALKPVKFDFKKKSAKDWEAFKQAYRKAEKPHGVEYMKNLKDAVRNHCSTKWAAVICRELDRLGPKKVEEAYKKGEEFADIDFFYGPDCRTDEFGNKVLSLIYAYEIENYFPRWYAALKRYTAKQAGSAERRDDFLQDARRFGAANLKSALYHGEQWALLYYHDKPTKDKLFETWTGIRKYI